MPRRTKIVATLGPATDAPGVLDALLAAGIDVARINFSHGIEADHRRRITATPRRCRSMRSASSPCWPTCPARSFARKLPSPEC